MPNSIQSAIATARTVLEGHAALVEEAGYTGSQELNLTLTQEGDGADDIRTILSKMVEQVNADMLNTEAMYNDRDEDGTYSANAKRKWASRLYSVRALLALARAEDSFMKNDFFKTRNFHQRDVSMLIGHDARHALLENTSCIFQYRIEESDIYPLVISWAIMLDGNPVSKGVRQPLQRFVSALFKPMQAAELLESTNMQGYIRGLADIVPTKQSWYFYLSNQNTVKHYQQFQAFNNTQSCMSYADEFYTHTGEEQHPMQCYDNSPDWNLMLISRYSPEDMTAMLDAAAENEEEFKYPFATRCMVLPKSKMLIGKRCANLRNRHFVFGKIYGHDQLVNYFKQSVHSSELMQQVDTIHGGRIPAIRSTREEYGDMFLLPYFDKENLAFLQKDNEEYWWISGSTAILNRICSDFPETTIIGIARTDYQRGTAEFKYYKVQHSDQWEMARHSCVYEAVTPVGIEYGSILNTLFTEISLDGNPIYLPKALVHSWAGSEYLVSDCAWSTVHNALVPLTILQNNPEVINHPRFGWVNSTIATQLEDVC